MDLRGPGHLVSSIAAMTRHESCRSVSTVVRAILWSSLAVLSVGAEETPVAAWRTGVSIRPVTPHSDRHTYHAYYLTCPESPDGTRVLYYASTTKDGHQGELVVRDRATGAETVVARNLDTEDAHRAACQQWISGGRRVAYHDVKAARWSVHVVDLATGQDRALATDRQLCFGRAVDDVLPVYGCHWNPGEHRDLELLDAVTGGIRTAVTAADVARHSQVWLEKKFGGRPTSVFFPHISPDGRRVFFKMSAPGPDGAANNYRSSKASFREGLFVYDLETGRPVFVREKWGHPAWHPDSRRIIEVGNILIDTENNGAISTMPELPKMPGCHPALSPDGRLFVMDGTLDFLGGPKGQWGVVVCDVRGHHHQVLHRFDNSRGAKSWRRNHPHPVFSPDGRRIYFNVNDGDWTRLMVAELSRVGPRI